MSRKNYPGSVPQRSHLVADRELEMALRAPRPKAFGIRRPLTELSSLALTEDFKFLRDDNTVPQSVNPRDKLHVTLLPKRKLSNQLQRGFVIGYEFGRRQAALEKDILQSYPDELDIRLGEAVLTRERFIGLKVVSEVLETQYEELRDTLGRMGLKGAHKDVTPLHITLGDCSNHLSRRERNDALNALNEVLPVGEEVTLGQTVIYPPKAA